jgi:hypothetical protein
MGKNLNATHIHVEIVVQSDFLSLAPEMRMRRDSEVKQEVAG